MDSGRRIIRLWHDSKIRITFIVIDRSEKGSNKYYQVFDSPFLWSNLAYPFYSTTAFVEKSLLLVFIVKNNFPCVTLKALVAKLIHEFKLLIGIYIDGLLQYAVVLQMRNMYIIVKL